MKVRCPVVVKMVLTPKLRATLEQDYQNSIQKLELELEQLQFQSKKLLQDASKKGPEAYKIVQERLSKEEKNRKEKIKQAQEILAQLRLLPDGSEIIHSQVESEIEVNVGDNWDKLMGKKEIVVKDGIIIEIRS